MLRKRGEKVFFSLLIITVLLITSSTYLVFDPGGLSQIEKKDIVKVEHRFLKDEEVARIALVAPEATINLIENGKLINKYCVELPETLTDIMRCPNPRCVSNKEREPILSKYQVISRKPIQLKCLYCWTIVEEQHIISEFTS